MKTRKKIDWEKQYNEALEAFKTNGFILLVDDRQAESLDQLFQIHSDTQISFLKLVPLVGG